MYNTLVMSSPESREQTIRINPGTRKLVIEIPNSSPRSTELREELRNIVRETATSARDALFLEPSAASGGDFTDRDVFDMTYGKRLAELGENLHSEGKTSGDQVVWEIVDVLTGDGSNNIPPSQAKEIAALLADSLGFKPEQDSTEVA